MRMARNRVDNVQTEGAHHECDASEADPGTHSCLCAHANLASHRYHKIIIVPPSFVLVSASYNSSNIGRAHHRTTFNEKHLHHAVEEVAIAQHVPAHRCLSKTCWSMVLCKNCLYQTSRHMLAPMAISFTAGH